MIWVLFACTEDVVSYKNISREEVDVTSDTGSADTSADTSTDTADTAISKRR